MHTKSPTAAAVEEMAAGWLLDTLDLPLEAAVGLVTSTAAGSFTALAAARGALLKCRGVTKMVRHQCTIAGRIAADLAGVPGITVMNDVVPNQIILRFGDDTDSAERRKTLATAVMDCLITDGMIFVEDAAWCGEWATRISVISGTISDANVAITTNAIRAASTKVLATTLSGTAAH